MQRVPYYAEKFKQVPMVEVRFDSPLVFAGYDPVEAAAAARALQSPRKVQAFGTRLPQGRTSMFKSLSAADQPASVSGQLAADTLGDCTRRTPSCICWQVS